MYWLVHRRNYAGDGPAPPDEGRLKMELRKLRGSEPLYVYRQSQQISQQTGLVGYLRGAFGRSGKEFWTTWFGFREDWNTPEFKADLQRVIDSLRFDTGEFSSRNRIAALCRQNGDCRLAENIRWFGFRTDGSDYAYLMRCCPEQGDYNFYAYSYHKGWLDSHMAHAERGIRFIDPDYRELFRIPDGGHIRITHSDGSKLELSCRYIDDTHVEIGSPFERSEIYHVCQFAEIMDRDGCTVQPAGPTMGTQHRATHLSQAMEQKMG